MKRLALLPAVVVLVLGFGASVRPAQSHANGRLQIHFMDVGQGDGAILISPLGETVLFDNGVRNHCEKPLGYLSQLGVPRIDYHVASHYHDDHIGCTSQVAGTIIIEVVPGAQDFTVRGTQTATTETYAVWPASVLPNPSGPATSFVSSKKSSVYHVPDCKYVAQISNENRESGTAPPVGKTLHQGCPR